MHQLPNQNPPQLQRLADARRVLEISFDNPFMDADDRMMLRRTKRLAWATIADVAELLVSTLDIAAGDADVEDATAAEDAFEEHNERFGYRGPGCPVADPGGGNITDDRHDDDDPREDDGEDSDGLENEPMFDRVHCRTLNALFGDGPGGGKLLDSDCDEGGI